MCFLLLILTYTVSCGVNGELDEANTTLYVTEGEGECESGTDAIDGECPTWTWPNPHNLNCCEYGRSFNRAVRWSSGNLSILSGYCMTYDSHDSAVYLAHCLYGRDIIDRFKLYYSLPLTKAELNSTMCDRFHRCGRLCGKCKAGYGSAIFSDNINCYSCSRTYHGWALYLAFELAPVTIMFIGLMCIQARLSQGSLNSFLFFAQVISYTYQFTSPKGSFPFGTTSKKIILVYHVVYGIFDFSFFRKLVPPFCVSEHLSGLKAISLLYTSIFYLLMLTALAYVLIELHAYNCKLLKWLWKPFEKYYKRMRQHVNPRNTLIDAFATSLLLSFSRVIYISLVLLWPTEAHTPQGGTAKLVLMHNGSIDFLSSEHLPYVLLSLFVLIVFIVAPILFLFAYPTTSFQNFIGKPSFGKLACMLHAFADAYQGCYKNGTNGTKDYRYFSGLYLLLRIVVCIGAVFPFLASRWIISGLIFLIMSLLFAHLRPYQQDIYNTVDSAWFAVATVFATVQVVICSRGIDKTRSFQIISQAMLGLPMAYLMCYMIHMCFWKTCKRAWRYFCLRSGPGDSEIVDTPYQPLENTI